MKKKWTPHRCPECRGRGGWVVAILWDGIGGGPFEECGFCNGTGEIKQKRLFYQILGWMPKRRKK